MDDISAAKRRWRPLRTDRLILRAFQPGDAPAFAAYRSDPGTARYQGWEAPYSVGKAAAFIEEMENRSPWTPGDWYQIALEHRQTGVLVGDVAFGILEQDHLQADIGYTLAPEHRRCGYAGEAVRRLLDHLFLDLGLHRVRAFCDVENEPSWMLLERLGMRREGHHVEAVMNKGRWCSEYAYAILQDEWLAGREAR